MVKAYDRAFLLGFVYSRTYLICSILRVRSFAFRVLCSLPPTTATTAKPFMRHTSYLSTILDKYSRYSTGSRLWVLMSIEFKGIGYLKLALSTGIWAEKFSNVNPLRAILKYSIHNGINENAYVYSRRFLLRPQRFHPDFRNT